MKKNEKQKCICPFCEEELKIGCFEPVFCQKCKITFVECKTCGQIYNIEFDKCPNCGVRNDQGK